MAHHLLHRQLSTPSNSDLSGPGSNKAMKPPLVGPAHRSGSATSMSPNSLQSLQLLLCLLLGLLRDIRVADSSLQTARNISRILVAGVGGILLTLIGRGAGGGSLLILLRRRLALQALQLLLGPLLGFVRNTGVADGCLEAASDVAGVLLVVV